MKIDVIYQIIIAFGVIAGGAIYIFSRIRKEDMRTLRESNEDLRSSLDDKSKRIDDLENTLKGVQDEMGQMQSKLKELEDKNNDLSSLVKDALVLYFQNNPSVAQRMVQKI